MSKRERNKGIYFMVSDKEREMIEANMKRAGIISMRAYLLKMALNGYIIHLELESVDELVKSMRNMNNNLNQVAKRLNATGHIYRVEIEHLQEQCEKLWDGVRKILSSVSKLYDVMSMFCMLCMVILRRISMFHPCFIHVTSMLHPC